MFSQEVGLNYKLVADIEGAPDTRTNFKSATLVAIETAYRWAPGSIERVLKGGDPVEIAAVTASSTLALTSHATVERHPQNDAAAQEVLDQLRTQAGARDMTLGEELVRRGLADPGELLVPDALPPDPIIEEVTASNISQETKDKIIKIHLENRARVFEEERLRLLEERRANESPDGEV